MTIAEPSTIEQLDRDHHLHPFNAVSALKENGVRVFAEAQGIYITDEAGKEYIDAMAGLWCVNLGYGRKELAEAAARQMNELPYYNTFFQSTTAPTARLSAKITSLAPKNINHVFFANSGSEANDTIMRLARFYWELVGQPSKKAIISRQGSYHGSTMVGASLCGMEYMHPTTDLPLPGFHHIMPPYHFRYGWEMDEAEFGVYAAGALERKILELGPENVALFHADTIAAGGGVVVPPETYWPEIVRICNKYDVLLSIDEVITGFGRVGAWFAANLYELEPDFMASAKGLSSGYLPISAAMVGDRVAQALVESGQSFNHGFTYSGHPTSAAVALENIRIMEEEGLIEGAANDVGPYLQAQLHTLLDHSLVGNISGRGLIAGVELVADKATGAAFEPENKATQLCFQHCLEQGLIARSAGASMVFSPPLIITRPEIERVIEIFRHCLDLTMQSLDA